MVQGYEVDEIPEERELEFISFWQVSDKLLEVSSTLLLGWGKQHSSKANTD